MTTRRTDLRQISEDLTANEKDIVERCLQAGVEGTFFPDWEFRTLMGAERSEVRAVWLAWPDGEADGPSYTVSSVLNNLLGYPHAKDDALLVLVPEGMDAIQRVFDKIWSRRERIGESA